ncbi:hypothetical protein N7449_007398 [Penicillium cf. viridicatum]|uniref:Uncharacterized protein n=1 Tax=Penicillium cf. viridicatum TaxID=2972119 RepID=A0A9W9JHB1_9EURO|nr:hypothetical protein N7449_007398 [Penicillium cf. viridicatum]
MHQFTNILTENDPISPFVTFLPSDRLPNTPKLSLSIELQCLDGPTIGRQNSYNVLIYHLHRDPNDGHEGLCTIYWSGTFEVFGPQGFVLVEHTTDGQLKKVEGVAETRRDEYPSGRSFWDPEQGFHELMPGQTICDWQYCELDHINCAMAGAFWFDYEGSVKIVTCDRFVSLAPGESWSDKVGGYLLPTNLPVGDEIRYQVEGCLLET